MKLSGDSLLICGDLRFSGRPHYADSIIVVELLTTATAYWYRLGVGKLPHCGMQKVKCGIKNCGNECGMVGKMWNAENVNRPT